MTGSSEAPRAARFGRRSGAPARGAEGRRRRAIADGRWSISAATRPGSIGLRRTSKGPWSFHEDAPEALKAELREALIDILADYAQQ